MHTKQNISYAPDFNDNDIAYGILKFNNSKLIGPRWQTYLAYMLQLISLFTFLTCEGLNLRKGAQGTYLAYQAIHLYVRCSNEEV